jgi:hypothetical protein
MIKDLLSKKPLKLFFGLLIFIRGALIIWFSIGEVYLTNDVILSEIINFSFKYSLLSLKSTLLLLN